MNERAYYELLESLPKGKMNSVGYVVGGAIPFKYSQNAAVYALKHDLSLEYDPAKCRELAIQLTPEVEYLFNHIIGMKEQARHDLDVLITRRDSAPDNNLFDHVQKELIERDINETLGKIEALSDVWQMLHGRKFELWECSRLKGDE